MWNGAAQSPTATIPRLFPCFRHEIGQRQPRNSRFTSPAMSRDVSIESEVEINLKKDKDGSGLIHTTLREVPCRPESADVLRFDKLQIPAVETCRYKRAFGKFLAREAMVDEEYWTAAWLRAESNWEEQPKTRYAESYKKKFVEQEFAAIKRRCGGQQHAEKCTCIVTVKKEKTNVKQTILKSIIGTLDISIRYLLQGQSFPGERVKSPFMLNLYQTDRPRYAYVSNVCVAKYARRQGIATNMLYLAVDVARSQGVDDIFIHVHRDNTSAQKLYEKTGFQMVETESSQGSDEDCNYLLTSEQNNPTVPDEAVFQTIEDPGEGMSQIVKMDIANSPPTEKSEEVCLAATAKLEVRATEYGRKAPLSVHI